MSVPGGLKSEYPPEQVLPQVYYSHSQHGVSSSPGSFIDNLFIPSIDEKNMGEEEGEDDLSSQWLSNFVEDCLFSSGNCIPPPTMFQQPSTNLKTTHQNQNQNPPLSLVEKPVGKSKRTKRKRPTTNPLTTWSSSHPHYFEHPQNNQNLLHVNTTITTYSDPPLLHQAYWLADSELIVPQKENKTSTTTTHDDEMFKKSDDHDHDHDDDDDDDDDKMGFDPKGSLGSLKGSSTTLGQQPRRCTHCLAQRTPQWRAGPLGPKTLCNACGVRFKSGRLLPEYRPAKSPTFVSYKYSNSHKKVMEMRMAVVHPIHLE